MATNVQKSIEAAIEAAYPPPPRIARLIGLCNTDLYSGPLAVSGVEDYPGFSEACGEIADWLDDVPSTIYFDDECGNLMESEPEGFEDDDGEWFEPEPYYLVESREIKAAIVGSELARYV